MKTSTIFASIYGQLLTRIYLHLLLPRFICFLLRRISFFSTFIIHAKEPQFQPILKFDLTRYSFFKYSTSFFLFSLFPPIALSTPTIPSSISINLETLLLEAGDLVE